jgi:eukaryotic-like serine/threonine-protein kinase
MDRAEGMVLAGKYALVSKLGQGGMGSVWRAEHVQLRSPVAIKLIDHQIVSNPEALARFMREAQSAAALRSPHVVQILDFGADQGVPYIAMELLDGESLAARLERIGRLTPAETAMVLTQVGRAISKAHEGGVVHRDLKPDNIFIVQNDEEEVAKVLDFGIAKAQHAFGVSSGSTTRTGAILGTPYYMSPEQAEGTKAVDHRTDLWALGVIAFQCLLGRRPFDSDALGSLLLAICTRPIPIPSSVGSVPPGFDAWFARACARELPARFQTARDLSAELRKVCGIQSSEARRHDAPGVNLDAPQASATPYGTGTTPYNVAQPTGNTYATSVGISRKSRPVIALTLGGLFLATAIAGVVAFIFQSRSAEAERASAAPVEPSSQVAATPVTPPSEVALNPVEQEPKPTPSAAPGDATVTVTPRALPARKTSPAATRTAMPDKAARAPASAAKRPSAPKSASGPVDLGI